jgi:hypothetical protein
MIWWSVLNLARHLVWVERKRNQASKAVKEAGRNCQVDGVEDHLISGERHSIYESLESLSKECVQLGLRITYQRVFELLVDVGNPHKECYWADIESGLKGVQWSIDKELLSLNFAFIPAKKAKFFEKDEGDALFGRGVYRRFKSARSEIKEAGNCLAVDLNTAAVFHLMRVTEIGLHALANELGVKTIGKKNTPIEFHMWGEIIGHIQSNLDSLIQGLPEAQKREKSQYYHGLLIECEAIKELWRNPVSHSGKSFKEHEAIAVFNHVRDFMTRLAAKVGETS